MNGAKPVHLHVLLNFNLKNTATLISLGMNVVQQCLNVSVYSAMMQTTKAVMNEEE